MPVVRKGQANEEISVVDAKWQGSTERRKPGPGEPLPRPHTMWRFLILPHQNGKYVNVGDLPTDDKSCMIDMDHSDQDILDFIWDFMKLNYGEERILNEYNKGDTKTKFTSFNVWCIQENEFVMLRYNGCFKKLYKSIHYMFSDEINSIALWISY